LICNFMFAITFFAIMTTYFKKIPWLKTQAY